MPFFVWSKVPVWRPVPVSGEVRTFEDLERFIPQIGAGVGLDPDKPLPKLGGFADATQLGGSHL